MICPYCMKTNIDGSHYCMHCGQLLDVQNDGHQLPVGTMLQNRYYVGAVIRQGGFGITYHGCDMRLNKKVAIKEYFPSGLVYRLSENSIDITVSAGDRSITYNKEKDRFTEEAKILAEFSKERNIVNVVDVFPENNTTYIVMEFVDGIDLDEYIDKHSKMSFNEAFKMIEPIIRTLDNVHERGLIHRDISPANIKVLPDGVAILLDFGAAREYREEEKSYSMILKPGYAPSEQYLSRGVQGPATDVYAICATLYKMITGVTPENSIDRMAEDNLKMPYDLGAYVSEHDEEVLMKGLAIMAKDRIQSMRALLDAFYCEDNVVSFTPQEEKDSEEIENPEVDVDSSKDSGNTTNKELIEDNNATKVTSKHKYFRIDSIPRNKLSIAVSVLVSAVVVLIIGLAIYSIDKKTEDINISREQIQGEEIDYYRAGKIKEEHGEMDAALLLYEKGYELSDGLSTFALGMLYRNADGVEADYQKAMNLFNEAVNYGCDGAYAGLGDLFFLGLGCEINDEKAYDYYIKATNSNETDLKAYSYYRLAEMYSGKYEFEKNTDLQIDYLVKCINTGNSVHILNPLLILADIYNANGEPAKANSLYDQALTLNKEYSDQGVAVAFYNLGYMYENGLGCDQDYYMAMNMYQFAADANQKQGINALGHMYEQGLGVNVDYAKAKEWYEKGVALHDGASLYDLGNMSRGGYGAEVDYANAEQLYTKAIELGNADAMNALGYMYDLGLGREADKEVAFRWYMKGGELGCAGACRNVGDMYYVGDCGEKDYDKALKWLLKGSELGDSIAKQLLGEMYFKGQGVDVNYDIALDYFLQAAEMNNGVAMNDIGYMYESGSGVQQDDSLALEWYQKGAELDAPSAINHLAKLYRNGKGVKKDYSKYIELVRKAADMDYPSALLEMGYAYNMGYGVEQDYKKAMEWYLKAAEKGNATAMSNIAVLYEEGYGVKKDQQKADEWYKKSEEAKNN